MPTHNVGPNNQQRFSDVIWRVRSNHRIRSDHRVPSNHSSHWVYLCLLIEFQSRPYKFMPLRILTYLGLFYEALIQREPSLLHKDALLPAAIPIVVYNGKPKWAWPLKLSELIEPGPEELSDLRPECSFRLVDEGSYTDEELQALVQNFAALLFRLENSRIEDFGEKIGALNEGLETIGTELLEEAFDNWLDRVIRVRFPSLDVGHLRGREKRTMLAENIGDWIRNAERRGQRKGRKEGREEGREEGRKEGRQGMQELIFGLIRERFGHLPAALEARIRQLTSTARLQDVARQIVRVDSLDEIKIG